MRRRGLYPGSVGLSLVLALALFMLARDTPAQAVPQLPHTFFGNVTISGGPASAGLPIEARIGTVNYAQTVRDSVPLQNTTTDTGGAYGVETAFQVCADTPDSPGRKEGGTSGEAIEFFVQVGEQWFKANTSFAPVLFKGGDTTLLHLSIPSLDEPAQPSTPSASACKAGDEPGPPPPGVCGDQNDDGVVTIADVAIDLQISVGLIQPTDEQLFLSDLDHSGTVDLADAIIGLKRIVRLIPPLTECGPTA